MRPLIITILLLVLLPAACKKSENNEGGRLSRSLLAQWVQSEHEAGRFSGAITVGSADSILFSGAAGIADRVWNTPMQLDYRFDIASVNKSFVGALIMLAVEEGKLSLQDRLTELLSDYTYPGRFHEDITVHHMLTHTSGLPDYNAVSPELSANNFRKFKRMHFSKAEYIRFISTLEAAAEPGKEFHYSNFAYHLLSIILEDIYNTGFPSLLSEKICKPLKLEHTFSETSNRAIHKNVVDAYTFMNGKWKHNPFIDLTLGRRIFSTSVDLYKWAVAMDDTTFLKRESLEIIKKNHLTGITDQFSYGYGWVVFEEGSEYRMGSLPTEKPYIIHGGSTDGYKSMLININKGEWIIALLSNIGDRTDEMKMAQEITTIIMNQNYEN